MDTFKDIVTEIRSEFECPMDGCGCSSLMGLHNEWASRIDRMASATARQIDELVDENARLKAALKPVLEVHITQDDESLEIYDSTMDGVLSVRAVHEAQRIYHDGDDSVNTKGDSVNGKVDFGDIEWELSTVKKENGNENA